MSEAREELSGPPRTPDVRVGSVTDGLTPISFAERSLAAGAWQWIALGLVVFASVLADQLTKQLVSSRLALADEVSVVWSFSIHHVRNSGIAFGLFSGATAIVIALTGLAIAWMVVFFARSGARHPVLPVGLGLVLGGSVSNLLDRVRLGYVTDFLHVRFWPEFNLADTFIVVGVVVLLGTLIAVDREPRRPLRTPADPPSSRL